MQTSCYGISGEHFYLELFSQELSQHLQPDQLQSLLALEVFMVLVVICHSIKLFKMNQNKMHNSTKRFGLKRYFTDSKSNLSCVKMKHYPFLSLSLLSPQMLYISRCHMNELWTLRAACINKIKYHLTLAFRNLNFFFVKQEFIAKRGTLLWIYSNQHKVKNIHILLQTFS